MTYPQALRYLESFINYERIPGWPYKESLKLERFRDFLARIGDPQRALKCVQVAGSKGKGSTCAFISYILQQAGYKAGLYTSPHLSDFRERIRILDHRVKGDFAGMISRRDLARLVKKLQPQVDKFCSTSKYGPLSFFEVYTALAFVYFKEKRVDYAVLETGLGGRLDATNTVEPLVCIITPISYEHTDKLGNTLKEIAAEKAGIIKSKKAAVISSPQQSPAARVIREKCRAKGCRLYTVGKEIKYRKTQAGFTVSSIHGIYPDLKIRLAGEHQLVNASAAVAAAEALGVRDAKIIRRGLYQAAWPGRCEVISQAPLVVLDGAQNIASARALAQTIRETFRYRKLLLVLGISSDKDIRGICQELRSISDKAILTRADNPRAVAPEALAEYFSRGKAYITRSVKEARNKARKLAGKADLVLVTGSLFVVGEFRDEKF